MLKLIAVLCITYFWLLNNAIASDSDLFKRIWKEINNNNYSAAEVLLLNHLKQQPEDKEAYFLYARTKAWNGDHASAVDLLNSLLEQEPKNTDYLLSKARILSWQSKNKKAIAVLDQAREISPNYFEVWQLELMLLIRTNTNKNKIEQFYSEYTKKFPQKKIPPLNIQEPPKKAFAQIIVNYDKLNNNINDEKGISLLYGSKKKKYGYIAKLDASNRFDISDQKIDFSTNFKYEKRMWLSGGISASVQQKLYPIASIYASVSYLEKQKWLGVYRFEHQEYKSLTVDRNQFSVSRRWKDLEPKIAFYVTTLDYNDITLSLATQITYHFNNSHLIRLSLSAGNELEYVDKKSIIHNTSNITLSGKYSIDSAWSIIYALSHHKQGTAYTKNGILSGAQFKF